MFFLILTSTAFANYFSSIDIPDFDDIDSEIKSKTSSGPSYDWSQTSTLVSMDVDFSEALSKGCISLGDAKVDIDSKELIVSAFCVKDTERTYFYFKLGLAEEIKPKRSSYTLNKAVVHFKLRKAKNELWESAVSSKFFTKDYRFYEHKESHTL